MCSSRKNPNPRESHGRSSEIPRGGGGGGVLKAKILDAKYEAKLEFPGEGGGVQNKNLREYGYFLELHIKGFLCLCTQYCSTQLSLTKVALKNDNQLACRTISIVLHYFANDLYGHAQSFNQKLRHFVPQTVPFSVICIFLDEFQQE